MTRTPDEIKKGIKCCHINDVDLCDCEFCPYAHKGWQTAGCDITMAEDALALIQQLQDDNAQLNRCIENMTDKLNAMNDEVAKLQAERDAAVKDLGTVCNALCICSMCKDRIEGSERCDRCVTSSNWQWRGVTKEDGNEKTC